MIRRISLVKHLAHFAVKMARLWTGVLFFLPSGSLLSQTVDVQIGKKVLYPGEETEVTIIVRDAQPGWRLSVYAVDDEEVVFRDTVISLPYLPPRTGAEPRDTLENEPLEGWYFSFPVTARRLGAVWGEYLIAGEVSRPGETVAEGQVARITGYKFEDKNGNGVWEGYPPLKGDEKGLAGWEIQLEGPERQTAFTDATGRFEFYVQTPGIYTISEVVANGWRATTPTSFIRELRLFEGETVAEVLFGNIAIDACNCDLVTNWDKDNPIKAGLVFPRATVRLPWGKGLPLRALAYDVDRLDAICTHPTNFQNHNQPCSNAIRIKMLARVLYEWEITTVQIWVRDHWAEWPKELPRGGIKERRSAEWKENDNGEQIRYFHPYLEKIGDVALVKMSVTVKDDVNYNAPKPIDEEVTFPVWLHIHRSSRDELTITVVEAPEPPVLPDLKPEVATVDCPCKISVKWENPSPIEPAQTLSLKVLTKERLELRTSAVDTDKLVLLCQGTDCESSGKEFILSDVLEYNWTAPKGDFPAEGKGSFVIYEAPKETGLMNLNLTVSDSKLQFNDVPAALQIKLDVVMQPVILVPGILGTELIYESTVVWPPVWSLSYTNILDVIAHIGNPQSKPGLLLRTFYGSVYDQLLHHGYIVKNFPYDWRRDNREHMRNFQSIIDAALIESGSDNIDIVTHSMGGLITRQWFNYNPNAANISGNIFFTGTPHHGSPKAYITLKNIKGLVSTPDQIVEVLPGIPGRALRVLWVAIISVFQDNVRTWWSVYQLLPTPNWFDIAEGVVYKDGEGYLSNWPRTYKLDPDSYIPPPSFHPTTSPQAFLLDDTERFLMDLPDQIPSPAKAFGIVSHTLDTDFRYRLPDLNPEKALGDRTVPAISGAWEKSAQNQIWQQEMAAGRPGIYYAHDVIHSEMMNNDRVQDFMIYVLESLRHR